MLQKMIGGIQSKSYDAIFQEALGNMESMLDTAIDDLDDGIERDLCILRKRIILQDANSAIDDFQYQVAKHEDLRLPEVDHVKVANFSGKGAAEKVFNEAEKSGAFETVRAFLSDVPIMRNEAHEVQMERDKILRVTQTLFFLRYKRETKNMKDSERARADFQGSLTDLEHIANASVCSVFHTSDKAQAAIAAATYDHLNIPTAVAHFSIKDDVTTFIHLPSQISAILDS